MCSPQERPRDALNSISTGGVPHHEQPASNGNRIESVPVPLSVLVAEDNDFDRRHVGRLLLRQGHRVELVKDGREALLLLHVPSDGFATARFDLLLLDLEMPVLDGFEVIRAIRAHEQVEPGHLPVIALTSRRQSEDGRRCLAAGMDDYLSKPVSRCKLLAAIAHVLRTHVERPPGDPQDPANEMGDPDGLLDAVVLLAACGDDEDGLREICEDFRTYAPGRLADVECALRDGNAQRLRQSAHKLCGLMSAFSTQAGDMVSELEEHASRGEIDGLGPLVKRIQAVTHQLGLELSEIRLDALQRRAAS